MLLDMAHRLKLVMKQRKQLMHHVNTSMITPQAVKQFMEFQLALAHLPINLLNQKIGFNYKNL